MEREGEEPTWQALQDIPAGSRYLVNGHNARLRREAATAAAGGRFGVCAGAGLCECEAAVRFRIIVFATPVVIGCVDHENEWSCAVAEARSIRCFSSSDVNWPSSFR